MTPPEGASPAPRLPRPLQAALLVLTGLAFFGWIGWLAYLSATAARPVVLSQPQFLVSDLDVVAVVESPDQPVEVREVLWPSGQAKLVGQKVTVINLPKEKERGWEGPGEYLLALTGPGESYAVTPTPPSPGHAGGHLSRARSYRLTPSIRAQYEQIVKPDERR